MLIGISQFWSDSAHLTLLSNRIKWPAQVGHHARAGAPEFFTRDALERHDHVLGRAFHQERLPGSRVMRDGVRSTELLAYGNRGKANRLLTGNFDFR